MTRQFLKYTIYCEIHYIPVAPPCDYLHYDLVQEVNVVVKRPLW